MPRRPRLKLAAVPLHIIQRGNNRGACFFAEDDYRFYLDHLGQACKKHGVDLHAYVLMTNHVHLLLTPEDGDGPSQVMKQLGQRYAQSTAPIDVLAPSGRGDSVRAWLAKRTTSSHVTDISS